MRYVCTGLNHKTAGVDLREKLAFSADDVADALADLHVRWPDAEFLLLSTCNRTEIYTARKLHQHPRAEELHAWLGERHQLTLHAYADAIYTHTDDDALRHLFCVASGLDSLVPGEPQIVSQLKQAFATAQETRALGAGLTRAVNESLHVAKHVRSETDIAKGRTSVASVAVDCIAHVFTSLAERCVLSIGSGEMNKIVLQQIQRLTPANILVSNRTAQRAHELAQNCNATVIAFESLGDELHQADVIVTSTGAQNAILTEAMIRSAQKQRRSRPMLILDLAVPRDVEQKVESIDNVYLYNIDDLENTVARQLANRHDHRDAAEAIIDEHLAELLSETAARDVTPTINAMYRRIESILADELADAENKFSTHDDQAEDMEILRRSLRRAMRRFCHPAADSLRRAADQGVGQAHADILRTLLDLDTPAE